MAIIVNVTDNSFDAEVLKCDIPVVTDFWAEWCGPCKTIAAHLADIAAEYEEEVKIAKLDIDANPATTSQYGVLSLPTLLVFKNGQVVGRITGAVPKAALLEKLRPHLKP